MCNTHYERARKGRDVSAPVTDKYADPEDAFRARTSEEGDCIVWTGFRNDTGYGMINIGYRPTMAHRYSFARSFGEIPDGQYVDHTCHNPACVKPEHLRLATPKQNSENHKPGRASETGFRGVYRSGAGYEAKVSHNGVRHRAGTFRTVEEAHAAARALRASLFTHSQD